MLSHSAVILLADPCLLEAELVQEDELIEVVGHHAGIRSRGWSGIVR
jgi:hypothetical protein